MLLAFKLFMTPLLIAVVTWVGRRWGPAIGGWLMGFPLTSGPISVFLLLQHGPEFAVRAAVGTMAGMASVCAFCLTYSLVSQVAGWPLSATAAILAFLAAIFCWNTANLPALPTFIIAILIAALVLQLIPRRTVAANTTAGPRWDIPARMAAAAAFVLLITAFSGILGPSLSGLLTPFPIFTVIIASFTHRQQGAAAASQLLRGLVLGSFAFDSFFLAIALLLPVLPAAWTYTIAAAAALAVNSIALSRMVVNDGKPDPVLERVDQQR